MTIFGVEIRRVRRKAAVAPMGSSQGMSLSTIPTSTGGWWPIIREGFAGAWQRNIEIRTENVLSFSAVYACVTLIASDIGKLRIKLVAQNTDGIWEETDSPAFSPVLRKPNHYQTRIKFLERWITSKLIHGNAYILKQRDDRNVVTAMYVLDPTRCRPLVAPNGDVYYALGQDSLAQVEPSSVVVPASEIIHDVMVPLYHDLCGVSPISACGLAAVQGLKIQEHGTSFFANGATPGGTLTTPGPISAETAKRLQEEWETNYGGANRGRLAVLGDGLEYKPIMAMNATDAQLIEQLKWTAENVCTAFHVPAYMVGVGPTPAYNNIEALNQQYYSQCLQNLIESLEILLDEGLGLDKARTPDGRPYGSELDLDDLLRMDTPSRVKAAADAIGSGGVSPNEARKRWLDLGPVSGGATPYLQQQNYSLEALAKRDAKDDPFAKTGSTPTPDAIAPTAVTESRVSELLRKALAA